MKHSIWLLMLHDGTLCEGWYASQSEAYEDFVQLKDCGESDGVTIIEATYETKY